jgi:hypothetical protein
MRIRGLVLPKALEDAVNNGAWMRSTPGPEFSRTSGWSAWNWCFYDFAQMNSETEAVVWIGNVEYPGFDAFESDRVLCIADRGYDWPVCLIYSHSDVPGHVVGFNGDKNTWERLADTFDQFSARLVELPVVKDEEEAKRRLPRGTLYITETGKRWRVGPPEDGVY